MSLFRTDPLLAFCRLITWFIVVTAVGAGLVTLFGAGAALVNGDHVIWVLRHAYPKLQQEGVIVPFFLGMALIAVAMGFVVRFLMYLLDMINSVARGEAFTVRNAQRIKAMAWMSLISMPLGFFIEAALSRLVQVLGTRAADAGIRFETFDGGFSASQILMTLLLFVLARLFAQAAAMRDEIEGTV
ncbi:MAG: DUF2975 domain-containing protein [Sphingobium sp.]|nr:DUF2975 domain-containing protein [Sphingobium sp.]